MALRRGELGPLVALLAMTAAWGSTSFMIKDVVTRMPVPDMLTVRFTIAAVALAVIAGPLRVLDEALKAFAAGADFGADEALAR